MKKSLIIAGVFLSMLVFAGTGCKGNKAQNTLYIYNWVCYIPDDVVKDFETKYNVKVIYDYFASNEEMFTKIKGGGTGYDITFPSGDYVSIMINEGMIDQIDKSKLPNYKYLDTNVLSKIKFDAGNLYSVPFMMAATGVAVNKKYVKDYPKDMSIFLRKDLKGRMTLLDDMREVLGHALKTLGYSVNSTNPAELAKAQQLVLQWKANIQKFDADSFGKSFAAGEFWVVQGYQENVMSELDENMKKDVDFFIPKNGGPMYIDSMVILKDSKNKELAYKFINYILEPEVIARVCDAMTLPSINVEGRKFMKVKPTYQIEDMKNCEFKDDISSSIDLYNKTWQEIRIGK